MAEGSGGSFAALRGGAGAAARRARSATALGKPRTNERAPPPPPPPGAAAARVPRRGKRGPAPLPRATLHFPHHSADRSASRRRGAPGEPVSPRGPGRRGVRCPSYNQRGGRLSDCAAPSPAAAAQACKHGRRMSPAGASLFTPRVGCRRLRCASTRHLLRPTTISEAHSFIAPCPLRKACNPCCKHDETPCWWRTGVLITDISTNTKTTRQVFGASTPGGWRGAPGRRAIRARA